MEVLHDREQASETVGVVHQNPPERKLDGIVKPLCHIRWFELSVRNRWPLILTFEVYLHTKISFMFHTQGHLSFWLLLGLDL